MADRGREKRAGGHGGRQGAREACWWARWLHVESGPSLLSSTAHCALHRALSHTPLGRPNGERRRSVQASSVCCHRRRPVVCRRPGGVAHLRLRWRHVVGSAAAAGSAARAQHRRVAAAAVRQRPPVGRVIACARPGGCDDAQPTAAAALPPIAAAAARRPPRGHSDSRSTSNPPHLPHLPSRHRHRHHHHERCRHHRRRPHRLSARASD